MEEVSLSPEEVAGIKNILENIANDCMYLDPSEIQELRQYVGYIGGSIKELATFLDNLGKKSKEKKRIGFAETHDMNEIKKEALK